MSFSNNCKSDKIPGPIRGNGGLNGICERACIQCDKVIDMCMRQESLEGISVTLTDVVPATGLTQPYTFVSAASTSAQAIISDLIVTPISDDPCSSRVQCTISVPIQVSFVDAAGVRGVGSATVSVTRDVVLHTSAPSVMPYSIVASASLYSAKGTYASDNTFTLTACLTTILKVIIQVQLLVPSYGYCYIPPCQDFNEQVCDGVFDLPLYPQECGVEPRCKCNLNGN
ncbi:MAG: hypothetical protein K2N57_01065 [Clostridia bacterium]|nr:hypothetical protein [Clostridia bacterium]